MTAPGNTETVLEKILQQRGILEAAQDCQWRPFAYRGELGWAYPLFNLIGQQYNAARWKAANSDHRPKYAWIPGRPDKLKYYLTPGAVDAIRETGVVYIATGEPDVLVYRAAGLFNTLCWFGEKNIPETLPNDLKQLGARTAIYIADRDQTGMEAAYRLWRLLGDVVLKQLPGEMGSKQDINDLWNSHGHDSERFLKAVTHLTLIDLDELRIYAPIDRPGPEGRTIYAGNEHTLRDDWIKTLIAALGNPDTRIGNRKYWRCPLPDHVDNHPSFRVSTDQVHDFPWPVCSCDIQNHEGAWDEVASALNQPSWEAYKAMHRIAAERRATAWIEEPSSRVAADNDPIDSQGNVVDAGAAEEVREVPGQATLIDPDRIFVDSRTVFEALMAELSGNMLVDAHEPLGMPYEWLRRFGGFADMMIPGKLVYLAGPSGAGKTTFVEVMTESWLREGRSGIWWGPEWSPREMGYRALQRHKGATMTQMLKQQRWYIEEQIGVPLSQRQGIALGPAAQQRAVRVVEDCLDWPGTAHYYQRMGDRLEKYLVNVRAMVKALRNEGETVSWLVIDYAQLWQHMPRGNDHAASRMEYILTEIKRLCVDYGLLGIVLIQPRKSDAESAERGDALTSSSGYMVQSWQCNLYLTLTPIYDVDGERTNSLTVSVVKNSLGQTGKVTIEADLANLRWPLEVLDLSAL